MLKKYFLIVLTFIILASIVCAIGCEWAFITKIYVNQDNPSDYLELKPNGTYYLYEEGIGTTGEWEVKGNELRLSWMGSIVVIGEIKGNKIIFPTVGFIETAIYVKECNNFASQLTNKRGEIGKIAFFSNRDGNYEIYVMNADGSGQTRLTNNPAEDRYPVWSPDAKMTSF